MINLLIGFCCGAAVAAFWRRLFVSRTAQLSVPKTLQRSCAWGPEYDVPTYLRRRTART